MWSESDYFAMRGPEFFHLIFDDEGSEDWHIHQFDRHKLCGSARWRYGMNRKVFAGEGRGEEVLLRILHSKAYFDE